MNVQAYILNISAIQSIEELREMMSNSYPHTVEMPLLGSYNEVGWYTAPAWIMDGDIVFFYHAVTANEHNKRLRRKIKHSGFDDSEELNKYLDYCDDLYKKYGGRIYAVGKVVGNAFYSESEWEHSHFKSRIFAPISNVEKLDFLVHADMFKEFIPITRHSGVTPVLGNDFVKLKSVILRYNELSYIKECASVSIPLREVKKGNWLQSANANGRRYLYEAQFRKYYVDYFLICLSDDGKYHSEISCVKDKKISGRADDCIKFNGKYLFAEVKLHMFSKYDLIEQAQKYCNTDSCHLGKDVISTECIYQNQVLLIDAERICIYDAKFKDCVSEVAELDSIKSMYDIRKIKNKIAKFLE